MKCQQYKFLMSKTWTRKISQEANSEFKNDQNS